MTWYYYYYFRILDKIEALLIEIIIIFFKRWNKEGVLTYISNKAETNTHTHTQTSKLLIFPQSESEYILNIIYYNIKT